METGNRASRYWGLYCAIFVICLVGSSLYQWLYLGAWNRHTWVGTLADVCGASLGISLLVAILTEAGVTMVLWAPALKRRFIEQGLQQGIQRGREQGLEEGQQQTNAAWEAWLQRYEEAQANNQPFTEPPPSRQSSNGQP